MRCGVVPVAASRSGSARGARLVVGQTALGLAYYHRGVLDESAADWERAIGALERAGAMAADPSADLEHDCGPAANWFGLAMAHARLGRPTEARGWYQQAARWMDENRPRDVFLKRLRAEAARGRPAGSQPGGPRGGHAPGVRREVRPARPGRG